MVVNNNDFHCKQLNGLCHGQKYFHLFSNSEAYHEQMGAILSSNGSLVIAL